MTARPAYLLRAAILTASCLHVLLAGTLPVYPGAQLDQEFERRKLRLPKIESKQYITRDSFDKVDAYYRKLAPQVREDTIDQKGHKRFSFREMGDDRNSTTIEWSNEDPKDKDKTFILVNIRAK